MKTYTPKQARKAIERDPSIKAAVLEGTKTPLMEHTSTKVTLWPTIKAADAFLRERLAYLEGFGYTQTYGTLKRGTFRLECDGHPEVVLSMDRR